MHPVWRFLLLFTHKGPAAIAIVVSLLMAVGGLYVSRDLQIGDLDPGAPELLGVTPGTTWTLPTT